MTTVAVEKTDSEKRRASFGPLPPLKWAGGKRWFVQRFQSLLPDTFNTYYEPFFGSGAVYFSLQPRSAVLSDINEELVNFYQVLQRGSSLFRRYLLEHARNHSLEYYYCVRSKVVRSPEARAARFLYLNRTCWNGLYRVNRCGEFNVPVGSKSAVILESDDFDRLRSLLSAATIRVQDFEVAIEQAESGDFVFIDPPYTVAHNNNGFVKYNETIFSWADQIRLRDAVLRAARRGVKLLITNAHHSSVVDLYRDFETVVVSRAGVIAGDAAARKRFEEIVIKCY
ncbi:DNA adenine methylase [Aquimonas voraii]|uniref:Site-specific DNA-methyltransferase (adenine-specific) n=1 Tax=Aquimonas voraii TaxID=265719 RepID=A0A1G6URA2_9GAMM|nr:Dam family site-specific DNA-(adenine-N6)-methyltransferase [Aquimonas voraii]SDD43928.1 DNA adenine methylase [Aquimonas voraii]